MTNAENLQPATKTLAKALGEQYAKAVHRKDIARMQILNRITSHLPLATQREIVNVHFHKAFRGTI